MITIKYYGWLVTQVSAKLERSWIIEIIPLIMTASLGVPC